MIVPRNPCADKLAVRRQGHAPALTPRGQESTSTNCTLEPTTSAARSARRPISDTAGLATVLTAAVSRVCGRAPAPAATW
jgi:hypothetical protein